jgi:hypothetical protein
MKKVAPWRRRDLKGLLLLTREGQVILVAAPPRFDGGILRGYFLRVNRKSKGFRPLVVSVPKA